MKVRLNYAHAAPGVYNAMDALDHMFKPADWNARLSC